MISLGVYGITSSHVVEVPDDVSVWVLTDDESSVSLHFDTPEEGLAFAEKLYKQMLEIND